MKEKDISAAATALEEELRKSIIKKLDTIRESITLQKGATQSSYYQMLIMIDDDLEDVLLNWDYDSIDPRLSNMDDLDDDDDY
jgi:hypothetical protein